MEPIDSNEEKKARVETDAIVVRETPYREAPRVERSSNGASRRWLAGIITVLLAFALGFVPMWLRARASASERVAAQQHVNRLQFEALAAGAAIDARRGEYEQARQGASDFFTGLMAELTPQGPSSFTAEQQQRIRPLLTQRDDLITLLARSDPASAERLVNLYLGFRDAVRGSSAAAPAPPEIAKP